MTQRILRAGEFDLHKASDFLRDNHLIYQHPDWLSPQERLKGPLTYALTEAEDFLAMLCTAREDPSVGWIRFFTCVRDGKHKAYFHRLLSDSISEQQASGSLALYCTATSDWITNMLMDEGFSLDTQVITLGKLILRAALPQSSLLIRDMEPADLAEVLKLDHLAFSPEWRLDLASLDHTFSHSAIATVGIQSNQMVAYCMTNAFFGSGHLNRLAVHPARWGQKLGELMLEDLDNRCIERGINQLTVNTQSNNERSIALYQRTGFKVSGEAMSIYRLDVDREN